MEESEEYGQVLAVLKIPWRLYQLQTLGKRICNLPSGSRI
jgi:hypothetical protein